MKGPERDNLLDQAPMGLHCWPALQMGLGAFDCDSLVAPCRAMHLAVAAISDLIVKDNIINWRGSDGGTTCRGGG
eukprot:7384790-Prymnesium_polylepis.1